VPTDVGGAWRLTPIQVMQLRAAIAAVNAIDMRDSDDNITARVVHLIDPLNPRAEMIDVTATVYGNERQPFITKVYATNTLNDNPGNAPAQQAGYIAIELYNPDTRPMSLSGWALGYINRYQTGTTYTPSMPNVNPQLIPFDTDPAWYDSGTNRAPVIPAGGYILIASAPTPPSGITL